METEDRAGRRRKLIAQEQVKHSVFGLRENDVYGINTGNQRSVVAHCTIEHMKPYQQASGNAT